MRIESRQHAAMLLSGLQEWDFGADQPHAFDQLVSYAYLESEKFKTMKELVAHFITENLGQNPDDYSIDRMEWA